MNPRLLLIVPATILFAGLIVHSWKNRGPRITWVFFTACIFFSFVRELAIGEVEYVISGQVIRIMGVALILPIGWTLSIYCAWSLAEMILSGSKRARSLFPLFSLTVLIVGIISFCVESTGGNVGWWSWNWGAFDKPYAWMPMEIIAGWMLTAFIFLLPFFYFELTAVRKKPAAVKLGLFFAYFGILFLAFNILGDFAGIPIILIWFATLFIKGPELEPLPDIEKGTC